MIIFNNVFDFTLLLIFFWFSKFAKGDSDSAKLIRSQFSEALRADNSKKFAAKTEQKEFEKFADEWDKNNPAPYNSAFRMQSIMDAYKESKKNKK